MSSTFRHRHVLLVLTLLAPACHAGDPEPSGPGEGPLTVDVGEDTVLVADGIRNRIEAGAFGQGISAAGAPIRADDALPSFYAEGRFEPVWLEGAGLSPWAEALLERIRTAERDGLSPSDYRLEVLDSLRGAARAWDNGEDSDLPGDGGELRRLVDLELLLTDAFMVMGAHLLHGQVDPESRQPDWRTNRNGVSMANVLRDAIEEGDVVAALDHLGPRAGRYATMQDVLEEHRQWEAVGGWGTISGGDRLERDSRGERVARLRERLAITGDYPGDPGRAGDPEQFDGELHDAVVAFQARHGLATDGVVGPATLRALNVPVEERIRQLRVNMERWRWLPPDPGERHILVNIPAFETYVVEDGERVRTLRSVVGRHYRQTPVFTGNMTYLVLAPYWHVPPGIAANDQLPRIRDDPGHVAQQNMLLLEQGTGLRVDPHQVTWEGVTGSEFNRRFRLRQEPGPHNALGRVKFMFPNLHNVYLHDTSAPELFDRATRDFSSGCIRIEHALELAEYLLADHPDWDRERIHAAVARGVERTVWLPEPIPVHIQYWTAWVDDAGRIQFREDLYNRDPAVYRSLQAEAPIP